MPVPKKRKAPKGLPKRTGKGSMKSKTQRHFSRALDKKYRRVLCRQGKDAADAWKLARLREVISKIVA